MEAPELVEDLISSILLRLPPADPASLVRASLVCKSWHQLVCNDSFLRRYREFHRTPPLLALFRDMFTLSFGIPPPRLFPTTSPSPFHRTELDMGLGFGYVVDCRYCRVLVNFSDSKSGRSLLVVWDPITKRRQELPKVDIQVLLHIRPVGMVLCAEHGCDHIDCHGAFCVVLLNLDTTLGSLRPLVYSSDDNMWSMPAASIVVGNYHAHFINISKRGAHIGDDIYFTSRTGNKIVKYDMCNDCFSIIEPPEVFHSGADLMLMADGSLGLVGIKESCLYVWSGKVNPDGVEEWVQCKVIELQKLIPIEPCNPARVIGVAEGVGVIFVASCNQASMIELGSELATKVQQLEKYGSTIPFMAFYKPSAHKEVDREMLLEHRLLAKNYQKMTGGQAGGYSSIPGGVNIMLQTGHRLLAKHCKKTAGGQAGGHSSSPRGALKEVDREMLLEGVNIMLQMGHRLLLKHYQKTAGGQAGRRSSSPGGVNIMLQTAYRLLAKNYQKTTGGQAGGRSGGSGGAHNEVDREMLLEGVNIMLQTAYRLLAKHYQKTSGGQAGGRSGDPGGH